MTDWSISPSSIRKELERQKFSDIAYAFSLGAVIGAGVTILLMHYLVISPLFS